MSCAVLTTQSWVKIRKMGTWSASHFQTSKIYVWNLVAPEYGETCRIDMDISNKKVTLIWKCNICWIRQMTRHGQWFCIPGIWISGVQVLIKPCFHQHHVNKLSWTVFSPCSVVFWPCQCKTTHPGWQSSEAHRHNTPSPTMFLSWAWRLLCNRWCQELWAKKTNRCWTHSCCGTHGTGAHKRLCSSLAGICA